MANVALANPDPERSGAAGTAGLRPLLALATAAFVVDGDIGESFSRWKNYARDLANDDPVDTLLVTVVGGALLFHWAEHGRNPRCVTYWDSLLYMATCLSVGYDDLFPKTPIGNAVAAAVQTFGPAMASAALAPPRSAPPPRDPAMDELAASNRALVERLDRLIGLLEKQSEPAP
jgi:hypothetical protein